MKSIELSKITTIPICNKLDTIKFLDNAIKQLDGAPPKEYANTFLQLKKEFYLKFQQDNSAPNNYRRAFIMSTRFGIDFFHSIRELILTGSFIESKRGEHLGEFDEYTNIWLKNLY